MRLLLVLFILIAITATLHAEFVIEEIKVTISNIQDDGGAHVHESIKLIIFGKFDTSVYDNTISSSDLSVWSTTTQLDGVKMHVLSANVDVRDFRLRPQPRTKCNPIQQVCHGELILDYLAYPSYNETTGEPIMGTGIFTIEKYKPRTKRYTLNPSALSFTTTEDGNILLSEQEYLLLELPSKSVTLDINPQPTDSNIDLPANTPDLSWNDIVLVKFSLIFDVEDSIDKEVTDFFDNILQQISKTIKGPSGIPLLALITILIGSYLYIIMAKRRGE